MGAAVVQVEVVGVPRHPGLDDGYFDDAHRIRESREFSGATPAQLAREQNGIDAALVGNVQDSAGARPVLSAS